MLFLQNCESHFWLYKVIKTVYVWFWVESFCANLTEPDGKCYRHVPNEDMSTDAYAILIVSHNLVSAPGGTYTDTYRVSSIF